LLVGLVYAAKGHDLAIESLAREGLRDVQLVCAGPGDASEYEALAVERGVADRVHFLGARRDVPELLAGADLLFLPSRWEGMPYVVLEAMASSRPIVATAVDGAKDLIVDGETGALAAEPPAHVLDHALKPAAARTAPARKRRWRPWPRGPSVVLSGWPFALPLTAMLAEPGHCIEARVDCGGIQQRPRQPGRQQPRAGCRDRAVDRRQQRAVTSA